MEAVIVFLRFELLEHCVAAGLGHAVREEREELGRIEREVGDEAVTEAAVVLERVRNCSKQLIL